MRPTPPDWSRINPSVHYDDAAAAIDFLCAAFGFEVRLRIDGEGGRIEHSELTYGGGLVMVSSSGGGSHREQPLPMVSPRQTGGLVTGSLAIFVDDADAHCAHARAHGAVIADAPTTTDYGDDYWADRTYRALDPEGHHWWFMQRVRGPGAPLIPSLVATLGALADPQRLQLVRLLAAGPRRSSELADAAGLTRPTTSRHLGVLRQAGLVEESSLPTDHRSRVYALRPQPLDAVTALVDELTAFWDDQLAAFADHVRERTS